MHRTNHSPFLDELTTVQVRDLIAAGWDTVIVPLGATEQHGPGLPLIVDNEHGLHTALRAARVVGRTMVGPVVTLGHSPEHAKFAGTISLSKATMAGIIHDVAESHARSGFRLVYFWVAHGGNHAILQEMLPKLVDRWPPCRVTGLKNLGDYVSKTWDEAPLKKGVPLSQSGSHAGEFETSMMLAVRPKLVGMDLAEAGNQAPFDTVCEKMMSEGIQAVSSNGVLGDQRGADAARGDFYLDALAGYLADEIRRERGW